MNFPSIRIEGSIVSPELFDRLEELPGQRAADFGLTGSATVKDEIARAWADAQDYWRIFHRKLETMPANSTGTTETRNLWISPLLGLLGYQLEYQQRGPELNAKVYPISHRAANRANTPVHIIGYRDGAGLDRKPERSGGPRMSAHALVQEYLNLADQDYGIVTNGRLLRLLRDSSRLVKLTYLEFDLDRIFNDGLFADFAVLYRLLHASRLATTAEGVAESLIERYHQDSVESGARIRNGLSRAVETAIRSFANGLLAHPKNEALRSSIQSVALKADVFYQNLLRLIYRLLFLLVIEERNLVYPLSPSTAKRDLYYRYYSLQRLRRLAEKRHLADSRKDDAWLALMACFQLFESGGPGAKLGIAPLAGDLFRAEAIGSIRDCQLDNATVLGCLRSLSLYQNPDNGQTIRVNYAALNVEEFGSVYEGLLEFEPVFHVNGPKVEFGFAQGDERAATGSHYTPDDLVQPLLKHSLDHLIAEKLKEKDKAAALLSLRVADISCGSGHILLAAARRIATELAIVRTGEEQPSPTAFRAAVRDVIRECIYGVDLNPLAVELCKVALWLEAHSPGEPLNFLDHHIKCGNAIVGFVRREELERGVPEEAFITLPGDDKDIAAAYRHKNKVERAAKLQATLNLAPELQAQLDSILFRWREISDLPEHNPAEVEAKKLRYEQFTAGHDAWLLQQIAAIPIAQFYLPKTAATKPLLITDEEFRAYLAGHRHPQGEATASAWALAERKRFFHWFLQFPGIIARGGFDCVVGNPPYLGGRNIGLRYGFQFSRYVKWEHPSAEGNCDLAAHFLLRAYNLLAPAGYVSLLTTKTIAEGETRTAGLENVLERGGLITYAQTSIKWPGSATVTVSPFAIYKGAMSKTHPVLNGRRVAYINSYLNEGTPDELSSPLPLTSNRDMSFKGSEPSMGFVIDHQDAYRMIAEDPRNREVICPYINGDDLNSRPDQSASRNVINFRDWPEERASTFPTPFGHARDNVFKAWDAGTDHSNTLNWWWHRRRAEKLYDSIKLLPRAFAVGFSSKYGRFSVVPTDVVFSNLAVVVCSSDWAVFSSLESTLHNVWAWTHSSKLGDATLRYTPSVTLETFPFPRGNIQELREIGERYTVFRSAIMGKLELGITDLYNLFHARGPEEIEAKLDRGKMVSDKLLSDIAHLRSLQVELDETVLAAYGWTGQVALGHDFHEVETLPEIDRVRYTIGPAARKELLKRLLALNHQRAAEEQAQTAATLTAKPAKKPRKKAADTPAPELDLGLNVFDQRQS